jgi:signal transduction histidine kinase
MLSAEIIEFDGEQCALMVVEDITERQRAEEARMDLTQRLINAQEAEATRIARELHDNIGQSLALLTMELDRTRLTLNDISDGEARLGRLSGKLKHLNHVVGTLSHQLDSSGLEVLGLAVAIRSLCREFSEQYPMQVHYKSSGVPDDLSKDVSLCLFRVMQEALHNAAKHSKATNIDVELYGSPDSLRLSVSDDGVGFNLNASSTKRGLGLISMRERLHLVAGKLTIISKLGLGTRIEAIVYPTKSNPQVSLSGKIMLHGKNS